MSLLESGHTVIRANRSYSRYACYFLVASLLLAFLAPLVVNASTYLSQGYTASSKLSMGSVVSLEKNSDDRVVPAATSNVDNLLGVVINEDSSLLAVTNGQDNQVQVATSGTVQVLVSDINGAVKRGDQITASPISGVGMKATGNVRTIGIAQNDMAGGTAQTYKGKDGHEQSVKLGQVSALVNVAYFFKEPEKTVIPTAIQNVANALAGKSVSTLPILIGAGIFIVMLVVVSILIYSMIRSSIISIGRNPMSQSAVYRDLIQLSALVIGILGVGVVAVYLVLTRL